MQDPEEEIRGDEERSNPGWPELRSKLPVEKKRREGDAQKTSYASEFYLFFLSPRGLYSEFRTTNPQDIV